MSQDEQKPTANFSENVDNAQNNALTDSPPPDPGTWNANNPTSRQNSKTPEHTNQLIAATEGLSIGTSSPQDGTPQSHDAQGNVANEDAIKTPEDEITLPDLVKFMRNFENYLRNKNANAPTTATAAETSGSNAESENAMILEFIKSHAANGDPPPRPMSQAAEYVRQVILNQISNKPLRNLFKGNAAIDEDDMEPYDLDIHNLTLQQILICAQNSPAVNDASSSVDINDIPLRKFMKQLRPLGSRLALKAVLDSAHDPDIPKSESVLNRVMNGERELGVNHPIEARGKWPYTIDEGRRPSNADDEFSLVTTDYVPEPDDEDIMILVRPDDAPVVTTPLGPGSVIPPNEVMVEALKYKFPVYPEGSNAAAISRYEHAIFYGYVSAKDLPAHRVEDIRLAVEKCTRTEEEYRFVYPMFLCYAAGQIDLLKQIVQCRPGFPELDGRFRHRMLMKMVTTVPAPFYNADSEFKLYAQQLVVCEERWKQEDLPVVTECSPGHAKCLILLLLCRNSVHELIHTDPMSIFNTNQSLACYAFGATCQMKFFTEYVPWDRGLLDYKGHKVSESFLALILKHADIGKAYSMIANGADVNTFLLPRNTEEKSSDYDFQAHLELLSTEPNDYYSQLLYLIRSLTCSLEGYVRSRFYQHVLGDRNDWALRESMSAVHIAKLTKGQSKFVAIKTQIGFQLRSGNVETTEEIWKKELQHAKGRKTFLFVVICKVQLYRRKTEIYSVLNNKMDVREAEDSMHIDNVTISHDFNDDSGVVINVRPFDGDGNYGRPNRNCYFGVVEYDELVKLKLQIATIRFSPQKVQGNALFVVKLQMAGAHPYTYMDAKHNRIFPRSDPFKTSIHGEHTYWIRMRGEEPLPNYEPRAQTGQDGEVPEIFNRNLTFNGFQPFSASGDLQVQSAPEEYQPDQATDEQPTTSNSEPELIDVMRMPEQFKTETIMDQGVVARPEQAPSQADDDEIQVVKFVPPKVKRQPAARPVPAPIQRTTSDVTDVRPPLVNAAQVHTSAQPQASSSDVHSPMAQPGPLQSQSRSSLDAHRNDPFVQQFLDILNNPEQQMPQAVNPHAPPENYEFGNGSLIATLLENQGTSHQQAMQQVADSIHKKSRRTASPPLRAPSMGGSHGSSPVASGSNTPLAQMLQSIPRGRGRPRGSRGRGSVDPGIGREAPVQMQQQSPNAASPQFNLPQAVPNISPPQMQQQQMQRQVQQHMMQQQLQQQQMLQQMQQMPLNAQQYQHQLQQMQMQQMHQMPAGAGMVQQLPFVQQQPMMQRQNYHAAHADAVCKIIQNMANNAALFHGMSTVNNEPLRNTALQHAYTLCWDELQMGPPPWRNAPPGQHRIQLNHQQAAQLQMNARGFIERQELGRLRNIMITQMQQNAQANQFNQHMGW